MPWEDEEVVVLRKRKGGIKKSTNNDSVWTLNDLLAVTFHETVQCVLIPSRHDYKNQGLLDDLWFSDAEINAATQEASDELLMTAPTNVSTMSLYAAMNLLYRPCSIKGKISHFNILIVDDSVVARKLITLNLVQQHKESGISETIYIHHADNYHSALQLIKKKSFNVVIIDHILSANADACALPGGTFESGRLPHRVSDPPKSALKSSSRSTRGPENTESSSSGSGSSDRGRRHGHLIPADDEGDADGVHYTWSDSKDNLVAQRGESDGAMSDVSSLVQSEQSDLSGLTGDGSSHNNSNSNLHGARRGVSQSPSPSRSASASAATSPGPEPHGPALALRRRQISDADSSAAGESMGGQWREVPTDNGSSCSSDANMSPSPSEYGGTSRSRGKQLLTRIEKLPGTLSPMQLGLATSADSLKFNEVVSAVDNSTTGMHLRIPQDVGDDRSTSSGSTDFVQSSASGAASGIDSAGEMMRGLRSSGGDSSSSHYSGTTGTSKEAQSERSFAQEGEGGGKGGIGSLARTRTRSSSYSLFLTELVVAPVGDEAGVVAPQPHRHRRSNSSHNPDMLEWGHLPGLSIHGGRGGSQGDDSASTSSGASTEHSVGKPKGHNKGHSRNKGTLTEQNRELTSSTPHLPPVPREGHVPASAPSASGELKLQQPPLTLAVHAPVALSASPKRLSNTCSDLTKLIQEQSESFAAEGLGPGIGSEGGEKNETREGFSAAPPGEPFDGFSHQRDCFPADDKGGEFSSIVGDAGGIGRNLLRPGGAGRSGSGIGISSPHEAYRSVSSGDSANTEQHKSGDSDPSGYAASGSDSNSPVDISGGGSGANGSPVSDAEAVSVAQGQHPSMAATMSEVRNQPPSPPALAVSEGLGLGGKAKNSFNEIQKLKDKRTENKRDSVGNASSTGMTDRGGAAALEEDIDAGAFALASRRLEDEEASPEHVIVGIEGKLSTLRSWEMQGDVTSKVLARSAAGEGTAGRSSGESASLRMADLYRSKKSGSSTGDLSVNSSSSHDAASRSVFESFKEPRISMADVDPGAWNGKDIIEVIREDTPCLIVGISSHIISDYDEAYDEGTHTVSAIRTSNSLRADFYRAGADLVWPKPVPKDAWQQIYDVMPIEF